MTAYRQGDVVLVPFPFTNLEAEKRRPAVIISADWYNTIKPDVIAAAATSSIPNQLERDEMLLKGQDLQTAGFPKETVIKAGKIFTIEQSRIVKPLGRLSPAIQKRLLDLVGEVFYGA